MNDNNHNRRALITFSSEKGWFFAEDLDDHTVVFVHQKHSRDNRYLHVNDLIEFARIDSALKPGKFEAREVRWAGRTIARQTSARGGQS